MISTLRCALQTVLNFRKFCSLPFTHEQCLSHGGLVRRIPHRRQHGSPFLLSGLLIAIAVMLPITLASGQNRAPAANFNLITTGISTPAALALLLPDGLSAADPGVIGWREAVQEEGLLIDLLSDAQFLAMGAASAV